MIHVRFFGIIRIQLKIASTEIKATNINDLLHKLKDEYDISLTDLKSAIIFLNGKNIVHQQIYKTKLTSGDTVDIFSPAGGG